MERSEIAGLPSANFPSEVASCRATRRAIRAAGASATDERSPSMVGGSFAFDLESRDERGPPRPPFLMGAHGNDFRRAAGKMRHRPMADSSALAHVWINDHRRVMFPIRRTVFNQDLRAAGVGSKDGASSGLGRRLRQVGRRPKLRHGLGRTQTRSERQPRGKR